MIGTLLTIAVVLTLIAMTQLWWRSHLNPVSIGILAWTPALILLNWPPYFLSPLYIHLNRPVSFYVYLAMAIAFASFWAGCAVVKALSPAKSFEIDPTKIRLEQNVPKIYLLFALGFVTFVYVFINSGLLQLQELDAQGVAESRLNLHVRALSFLVLFMDVAAIALFVRFLQRGSFVNFIPIIIALLCQAATLQKSRFMFLVLACIFVAALHPRATYHFFLRSAGRKFLVVGAVVTVVAALFAMNAARGIAVVQMTAASSPIMEQIYIYSGASAIQNVSVTLDGYLPSDPPAMGVYLARPILWYLVDRDMIFATRYFEGVNAATYMIYGWADFRWAGFFITPFITGILAMLFLRLAFTGTLIGFMLGVVQMQVLVYSVNTDVMFDPTTWIIIGISLVSYLFTRRPKVRRQGSARAGVPPDPGDRYGPGPPDRQLTGHTRPVAGPSSQ